MPKFFVLGYNGVPVTSTQTSSYAQKKVPVIQEEQMGTGVPVAENLDGEERTGITEEQADLIYKTYRKDPEKVVDVLESEYGFSFNDKEKTELKEYLKDKKALKAFMQFSMIPGLSEEDIIKGIEYFKELKSEKWYKRAFNSIGKAFTEGLSAAWDYAQSEMVYKARKAAHNMGDVRGNRPEFSSDAVAQLGVGFVEKPETEESTRHLLLKKNKDGSYLYAEETTLRYFKRVKDMAKEEIEDVFGNILEIEGIQTPDGYIKYQGDTIVDTGFKMNEHKELKSTIKAVAVKEDMNDACLTTITDNLCENPEMEEAIRYSVTAKREDGTDIFTAQNVCDESNHLLTQNADYCQSYTSDLKKLSESNPNLSGGDILAINDLIQKNPEHRDAIIAKASNPDKTGSEIVEDCQNYIKNSSSDTSSNAVQRSSYSSDSSSVQDEKTTTSDNSPSNNPQYASSNATTDPIKAQSNIAPEDKEETITVDGKIYPRKKLLDDLKKVFFSDAERILQKMESDSMFMDLMKMCGGNRQLREVLVADPMLVPKLRKISSSLTVSDLAEMAVICKNPKFTEALIGTCDLMSPQNAVKFFKGVSTPDDVLQVVQNNEITKAQKLEMLQNITGKNIL